jgi:hypothetical protein
MPGKKLKFPKPDEYQANTPLIFCPAERVIGLYNQATGKDAKKMAKKLKEWFIKEAKSKGWAGCHVVPEVQSKHGAGYVLLNPPSVSISINKVTIVFPA